MSRGRNDLAARRFLGVWKDSGEVLVGVSLSGSPVSTPTGVHDV